MLPAFREDGWLPEGHYGATWDAIIEFFGGQVGSPRALVLANLLSWRDAARLAGLSGRLLINGSFVSTKLNPGDFDLIFIYDTATKERIDGDVVSRQLTSYDFCKSHFSGDIFVFWEENINRFPAFCDTSMFDRVKDTGIPKGVLEVSL